MCFQGRRGLPILEKGKGAPGRIGEGRGPRYVATHVPANAVPPTLRGQTSEMAFGRTE
jgi:hypothetical protein